MLMITSILVKSTLVPIEEMWCPRTVHAFNIMLHFSLLNARLDSRHLTRKFSMFTRASSNVFP